MACLTYKCVLLFVVCVSCAPEGYNYKKPDVAFELPSPIQEPPLAGQIYQNSVSYSISNENYGQNEQVLNNGGIVDQAIGLQNNVGSGVASLPLGDVNNGVFVQNSAYSVQNSVPLPSNNLNAPPVLEIQAVTPSNSYYQNGAGINNGVQFNSLNGASNAPVLSPSSPVNVQIASQNYQNTQQLIQTQQFVNGQNGAQSNEIIAPVVMKHIYFHVPPPDVEQTFNVPVPQRKKTYKILFIKLPQQSRKSLQVQSSLSSFGPVEEKTLIYVLVKKPEASQVIVPTVPKLSEHEVLFVKYRENRKTNTEEIARVVDIPKRNPQINVQVLEPGFVNGKW